MNNFIPETPKEQSEEVPFYDDVRSDDGWQGQTTTKTVKTLQSEITQSISRLGGMVTGFQKGQYMTGEYKRDGFRVLYAIPTPAGAFLQGRIDIAALPVKDDYRKRESYDARRDKSLRMALYMLRVGLDGTWFLQQLSPGYSALMPWMLANGEKTVSELWAEHPAFARLMPPKESEFKEL